MRRSLPNSVLNALRQARRSLRRLAYHVRRVRGANVRSADIEAALHELGITAGDDVMLHSSLRGLGVIDGGAEAVVHAFQNVIGLDGTLLVPAYPLRGTMFEHLRDGGIALDVRHTPSQMGKISEVLRSQPGSHRSLHPTHSVVALGPRAQEYVRGHEASRSPCGPESPFVKLIDRRGWIVALGSPIGKVTSYHVIEDTHARFPINVYLDGEFEARVVDASGAERLVPVKCHDPALSPVRIDNNRSVEAVFERLLAAREVLYVEQLGDGFISAMRADRLQCALEDLLGKGVTIYDVSRAGMA